MYVPGRQLSAVLLTRCPCCGSFAFDSLRGQNSGQHSEIKPNATTKHDYDDARPILSDFSGFQRTVEYFFFKDYTSYFFLDFPIKIRCLKKKKNLGKQANVYFFKTSPKTHISLNNVKFPNFPQILPVYEPVVTLYCKRI